MSFLAPLWLALGAAALVPLLLHLLRRRVHTEVDFPAARYLLRAEREHSRTLKLRNLLLMLLRVLALLLIALAAARPVTRWLGGAHAPTALALVVDNSLSSAAVVGGVPVIERFRGAARDALRRAAPSDRVWLVTADGGVRGGTRAELLQAVESLTPLAGAGDPRGALARALEMVRAAPHEGKVVAILSDAQRTAWQGTPPASSAGAVVGIVAWAPAAPPPTNRALVTAAPRPVRWPGRGTVAVRVAAADSAPFRIELGGATFARGTAGDAEVEVRGAAARRGWLAGKVELPPDEFPADDVRHFVVFVGDAPRASARVSAGTFVGAALEALGAAGRVTPGGDLSIRAADEPGPLPAILVAPRDPVRAGVANRELARLGIPWRFAAFQSTEEMARGVALPSVVVHRRFRLAPSGGGGDTLAVVGREPWIVGGERWVVVASALDPEWSALPTRADFVPWLGTLLETRLSLDAGGVLYAAPGARVPRPTWASAIETSEGPEGTRPLEGGAFDAPARTGTYFLLRDARRVGALVVNPEARESELARLSSEEWRAQLRAAGGGIPRVVRDESDWAADTWQAATQRGLAGPMLAAALVLLITEGALARGGTRGQGS